MAFSSPSVTAADNADEEIIELTDIVEKGTVPPDLSPAPDAGTPGSPALQAEGAGGELEGQMSDLFSSSAAGVAAEEEAFDLDALLGQMEEEGASGSLPDQTGQETAHEPAEPAAAATKSDPADAAFDDVDALLRDLVAPEQPEKPDAAPAAQAGTEAPASEDTFGDLDSLLADLDGVAEGLAPTDDATVDKAAEHPSPAEDSFAQVLAAATAPDESPAGVPLPDPEKEDGEVEDLDALLDSIMNPDSESLASPAGGDASAEGAVDEEDNPDLDALLAAAEADQQALDQAGHAPLENSATPAGSEPFVDAVPDIAEPELPIGEPAAPAAEDAAKPVSDAPASPEPAGNDVFAALEGLAGDIAALQARVEQNEPQPDSDAYASLQEKVERLQAEVEDMAETHAAGLASAEARISALEAELAERDAALAAGGGTEAALAARLEAVEAALAGNSADAASSEDNLDLASGMVSLEDRLSVLEAHVNMLDSQVEKAASEAAARVIREEIAALLADMAGEGEQA